MNNNRAFIKYLFLGIVLVYNLHFRLIVTKT